MSTFFLQFLLSFLFVNKTLRLNNLKTRTGMNEKNSMFCICVEAIIYLLSYNQHDCTFSSVPYDFHCLILCNQTSNLIIITILNANMQYIFIHKKLWGGSSWSSTSSSWSGLVDVHVMSVHKLSFHHILIILLRPLSAHALFKNGSLNKDGQKNKREYINKPETNACKDYSFHK